MKDCGQLAIRSSLILLASLLAMESFNAVRGHDEQATGEAPGPSSDEQWGHLRGRIRVVGDVPPAEKFVITNDRDYCGDHDLKDESLLVGKDQGLQNVFVYLYQTRREQQHPAIHPDYEAEAKEPVTLDNANCRFSPHVLCVRTSQPLIAKNSDPVGHNANIESRENAANQQIPANQSQTVTLDTSEREPVKVSCGSHGWMSAYLLVRDEPYMTVTDATGSFEIRNLPAGDWTFQFWHERVEELTDLELDGQPAVGRKGELKVTIRGGETTDLGEFTISVSDLAEDQ